MTATLQMNRVAPFFKAFAEQAPSISPLQESESLPASEFTMDAILGMGVILGSLARQLAVEVQERIRTLPIADQLAICQEFTGIVDGSFVVACESLLNLIEESGLPTERFHHFGQFRQMVAEFEAVQFDPGQVARAVLDIKAGRGIPLETAFEEIQRSLVS